MSRRIKISAGQLLTYCATAAAVANTFPDIDLCSSHVIAIGFMPRILP